ncbi:hypothetical protein Tco_0820916 [Tanacetum coccineum]|uniref:Uncharacterized protein n=1 Tax=Tanacetum coccineum TaxID=301880 RepID=A0ABQ5ADF2_9ASTR
MIKSNDFDMKKELCAHQETISIMSQAKEAQIKLYKTREDKELDKVIALENKVKVLNDIVYKTGQSVQTMNMLNRNCKTSFAKPEFLKKAQRVNPRLYDIGCYNDNLALILAPDFDETIHLEKECRSNLSDLIRPFDYDQLNNIYGLLVPQREKSAEQHYFPKTSKMSHTSSNKEFSKESFRKQTTLLEKRMDESIPWDQNRHSQISTRNSKTQFLNEIDRLSREYYYADHMNAILGVYTDLDEFTNLQCDYVETWEKCEHLEKELSKSRTMSKSFEALQKHAINLELDLQQCKEKIKNDKSFKENQSNVFLKEREQYFEIQDLKAQLQDKGIAISELKKLIEKMKGKSVETKFEKSSVIRQPNAFKSQRQSILGKPAIFSDSLAKKDFSKSKPVTTQNVSNDFSKPVTTQILRLQDMYAIVKNTNVIAPGMYKVHTKPNQTRTPQLHQDIRKPNKRVSFSTGVIPNTSVSRPQLKSNHLEDRVMSNNSQGKKQEVEDHRRKLKGNSVDTKFDKTSVLGKPVLPSVRNQSVVRQPNAFKSARAQMSKQRFASQVDIFKPLLMIGNQTLEATIKHLDSKNFVCSTCHKCAFNANHDAYITKLLKEVNSRAKIQSNKTTNSNKPVDQKSHTQKPGRQIFIGHRFSPNTTSAVHEKTSPRSDLRWKPTGRIFKSVGLRWIPTGKLFDSFTSKVDSEPPHGSNEDIPNIHACKQTLDVSAGTSINVQKEQNLDLSAEVHQAAETVTTSNELDVLFGPLFDEYFNGENQVVLKSSAVTTTDASNKRQQQPDSTSSTSTLATTVTANGNFDL